VLTAVHDTILNVGFSLFEINKTFDPRTDLKKDMGKMRQEDRSGLLCFESLLSDAQNASFWSIHQFQQS